MTEPNKPTAIDIIRGLVADKGLTRVSAETDCCVADKMLIGCILELDDLVTALQQQIQTLQHNPWNSPDAKIQEALVEAKMVELQLQHAANKVRSFDIDPSRPMSMEEYLFGKEKVPDFNPPCDGRFYNDPNRPGTAVRHFFIGAEKTKTETKTVPGFSLEELQQEKEEQANQVMKDFERAGLVEKTFCGLKPGQTYNGPDGNKWTFTQEGNPTAPPPEKDKASKLWEASRSKIDDPAEQARLIALFNGKPLQMVIPAATTPSAPSVHFDEAIELLQVQLAHYRYLAAQGVSNMPANLQAQKSYEAAITKLQAPAVPAADVSYFIERLQHALSDEDGDNVVVFDGVYDVAELQAVLAILQRNKQ